MNMDRKILAVLVLVLALASGCDWIRAKLDMPTSEDIAKKKELIARKEAAEKATAVTADSLVAVDSVAQQTVPQAAKPEAQKPEPTASGCRLPGWRPASMFAGCAAATGNGRANGWFCKRKLFTIFLIAMWRTIIWKTNTRNGSGGMPAKWW